MMKSFLGKFDVGWSPFFLLRLRDFGLEEGVGQGLGTTHSFSWIFLEQSCQELDCIGAHVLL